MTRERWPGAERYCRACNHEKEHHNVQGPCEWGDCGCPKFLPVIP